MYLYLHEGTRARPALDPWGTHWETGTHLNFRLRLVLYKIPVRKQLQSPDKSTYITKSDKGRSQAVLAPCLLRKEGTTRRAGRPFRPACSRRWAAARLLHQPREGHLRPRPERTGGKQRGPRSDGETLQHTGNQPQGKLLSRAGRPSLRQMMMNLTASLMSLQMSLQMSPQMRLRM